MGDYGMDEDWIRLRGCLLKVAVGLGLAGVIIMLLSWIYRK